MAPAERNRDPPTPWAPSAALWFVNSVIYHSFAAVWKRLEAFWRCLGRLGCIWGACWAVKQTEFLRHVESFIEMEINRVYENKQGSRAQQTQVLCSILEMVFLTSFPCSKEILSHMLLKGLTSLEDMWLNTLTNYSTCVVMHSIALLISRLCVK